MRKKADLREIVAQAYRPEVLDFNLRDRLRRDGTGLVSCFKVSDEIFERSKSPPEIPGIFCFDGDFHCKGEFVALHELSTGEEPRLAELLKKRGEPFIQNSPLSPIRPKHLFFTPNAAADGYDKRNLEGRHRVEEDDYPAMVLLADEEDLEGNSWYLLQNWWPNMPLVLVTAPYLRSCGASICFVTRKIEKKQTNQPA